ncbi:helix-turn-helix transcriptional regulator [Pseudonocardia sp. GCM10023141]|uniref:helix-turn-helix transcriptional regulator n=1 Tax=Pseudonocardia sp. GCM10023141 TaxID=3252653 RepID=UPI003614C8E0
MATLSASAYVVLGLLREWGPATPYALDRTIRQSIGHFWVFPRSQLYAEAARLVRLGLVAEEQEDSGRRRRLLSLTPAGAAEFGTWLATPTQEPTEIRDAGLLRLFFHAPGSADADAVLALAQEQGKAHRRKLAEYDRIAAAAHMSADTPQAAALELGLRFERMAIAYWDEITAGGSRAVTSSWAGGDSGA